MDNRTKFLLIGGIILTIILFFVSIYLAGIVFIITAALVMSLAIMQDSSFHPDIVATLREDAKAIIVRNSGNAMAGKIHMALVPVNREFDLPMLAAEETHEFPLDTMAEDIKVVITFENEQQQPFSRSYNLSAMGGEFEPLKPMIPIFKWK
jgi:hypothetical protein